MPTSFRRQHRRLARQLSIHCPTIVIGLVVVAGCGRETAKLDRSYARSPSPVTGVTSISAVAEGTHGSLQNSPLTTVSVLTPMSVNLSISENEVEQIRNSIRKGLLKLPADSKLVVEIEPGDENSLPYTDKITFADPSYNSQTGAFLIRATIDNPDGLRRPNQCAHARRKGAVRSNAILLPQRAVQQEAQGHFVWLVSKTARRSSSRSSSATVRRPVVCQRGLAGR